ncbi:MAG: ferritin-like domain-containing protein, partial [Gemmatimonadetes bacterium]|nr:ferritin-like domain-containing protein [Gemmatimonadota bacterium]
FDSDTFREFAQEIAADELAHVRYLRDTLGAAAVSRPPIDFTNAFNAAGRAAGLGAFDPFADEVSFLLGAFVFEDVGVTAYKGAAPLIDNKAFLSDAAGILAVEAYHAGNIRSVLYQQGFPVQRATWAISDARDSLDGASDLDQGVNMEERANIVPADRNALAFSRTPQQVLRIVYLTNRAGVDEGGFFPQGVNGRIQST